MNNTFKMTALAASIAAVTACSSDNKKSNSQLPGSENPAVNSNVFNSSQYTPVATPSDSLTGTWILTQRFTFSEEPQELLAAKVPIGPIETSTEEGGGAEVSVVYIEEEGSSVYLELPCDDETEEIIQFIETADGSTVFEMSEDEEGFTALYTLDFNSSNTGATLEYDEEEIEGGRVNVGTGSGQLVKISNQTDTAFNAGGMAYDGESDAHEGNFDVEETARCFMYRAKGKIKTIEEDYGEGNVAIREEIHTEDRLFIDDNDEGDFDYSAQSVEYEQEGTTYVEGEYELEVEFWDEGSYEFSFEGNFYGPKGEEPSTEGDAVTLNGVTVSDGAVSVSGTAESEDGYDILNVNFTIDSTDMSDIPE